MTIPSPIVAGDAQTAPWAELSAEGKRERLLRAAGEVFAREGIEAPMPAIAAAAGAGVGSVYRQFPSKEDLLAALVLRRLDTVADDIEAALAGSQEPWQAFTGLMWRLADLQASDDVAGEAIATVSGRAEVAQSAQLCEDRLELVLSAGREAGRLREDASASDVRLLLAAVRATRRREADGWRRMLELGLDGLAARNGADATA